MRTRLILLYIAVVACVALLFLLVLPFRASGVTVPIDADLATQSQYWAGYVGEHGAPRAYEDFSQWVAQASVSRQHTLAHVLGGALYEVVGTDGLSVCTGDFSYGCYHEFLGQAIHQEGLGVIPSLNDACVARLKDQALGCQHGIGHGITGYLGYDLEALTEALDICTQLATGEYANGCTGGVFMEYNLQTLLAEAGETRPYDATLGWAHPCDQLGDSQQAACYFWQTQWWQSITMERYPTYARKAVRMGDWCNGLADRHVARECFRGIGNNAPGAIGYDPAEVVRVCDSMPVTEGVVECRAGAAGALLANAPTHGIGYQPCDGLAPEHDAYCRNTANAPH